VEAIVADRLTKFYSKHLAVDHISFKVTEGEIFGFLGQNGAGKTTTIKMLNTLSSPSNGEAFVGGYSILTEKAKVRRVIGLVPQEMTLDRDMTGRENLSIQAVLYDVSKKLAKEKIDELLRLVDLRNVADRQVSTYSWGMQKRLELIMGLVHNPKVLFLDEPTLGLDAQSRSLIWDYIRRLNRDFHLTVFLTTHYLEEADELCNRIAIIGKGSLQAFGTPEQLKDSFGGEYVELELFSPRSASELGAILSTIPGVVNVTAEGVLCHVQTQQSESAIPKLVLALAANKIETKAVRTVKTNLNQVFMKHVVSHIDPVEQEDEYKMQAKERLLNQRT